MFPNHQDSASVALACFLQGSYCTQEVFTLPPWIGLSSSLSQQAAIICPPHILNLSFLSSSSSSSHDFLIHTDISFSGCCSCNDHISCRTAVKQLLLLFLIKLGKVLKTVPLIHTLSWTVSLTTMSPTLLHFFYYYYYYSAASKTDSVLKEQSAFNLTDHSFVLFCL